MLACRQPRGIQSPATFLCVLYDLANRLLQAVGSQHELLPRTEYLRPGWAGRPHSAVPGGARATAAARPLPVFHLLGDGGGRRGQRGRGLGLVIQGLEERIQLLFQDSALGGEQRREWRGCGSAPTPTPGTQDAPSWP